MSPTAKRIIADFAAMTGAQQKCVLRDLLPIYWHSTGLDDDKCDTAYEALSLNLTAEEMAPSPELLEELRRRIAAHDADPTNVFTWDEVLAHVHRV